MRLRELREEAGMSLQDVGDLLSVTRNAVSLWERVRTEPSNTMLITIADIFGVTVDYLLGRPGARRDSPQMEALKLNLVEYLRLAEHTVQEATPEERAAMVAKFLLNQATQFTPERLAKRLQITSHGVDFLLRGEQIGPALIEQLSGLTGVPLAWFYLPQPRIGAGSQ